MGEVHFDIIGDSMSGMNAAVNRKGLLGQRGYLEDEMPQRRDVRVCTDICTDVLLLLMQYHLFLAMLWLRTHLVGISMGVPKLAIQALGVDYSSDVKCRYGGFLTGTSRATLLLRYLSG